MSNDFRLLMLGAMYENGGNTTHRFLDGHPQLFVYPFESQIGTRWVNDHAHVDVPGEVPLAGLRARRHARAGLPRHHRRGVQGPRAHAAREQVPPRAVRLLRRRARRASTASTSTRTGRSRPNNVAAFFRATFDAWKDSPAERTRAGLRRLQPDHRRRRGARSSATCRRRTSCTSCATRGRRTPTPRSARSRCRSTRYLLGWTLNQYYALLVPRAVPGSAAHRARRGRDGGPARRRSGPSATRSASSAAESLAHAELERPGPRGGLPVGHDPRRRRRSRTGARPGAVAGGARRDPAARLAVSRRLRLPEHRLTRALLTGATGFVGANLVRRLLADGVTVALPRPPGTRAVAARGDPRGRRVARGGPRRRRRGHGAPPARATGLGLSPRGPRRLLLADRRRHDDPHQRRRHAGARARVRGSGRARPRQHRLVVGVRTEGSSARRDRVAGPEQRLRLHEGRRDAALPPLGAAPSPPLRHAAALHGRTGRGRIRDGSFRRSSCTGCAARCRRSRTPRRRATGCTSTTSATPSCARRRVPESRTAPSTTWAAACRPRSATSSRPPGAILGVAQEPRWGAMRDRGWDTSVWVADPRAARDALGWEPRTSFADGFARTVEWFRQRPATIARYQAKQTA